MMRDAYEDWCKDNSPMSFHQTSYDLWRAAYRAGQEAVAAHIEKWEPDGNRIAATIRTLPMDDQP